MSSNVSGQDATVSVAPPGGTGSIILPQYTERRMMFYPVTVREMRELSVINFVSVVFFSLGSFFLSLAIGFWEGAVFAGTGPISPEGEVLKSPGAPIALAVAVIFYALGIVVLVLRGRTVNEIRNESRQITAEVRIAASDHPEQEAAS